MLTGIPLADLAADEAHGLVALLPHIAIPLCSKGLRQSQLKSMGVFPSPSMGFGSGHRRAKPHYLLRDRNLQIWVGTHTSASFRLQWLVTAVYGPSPAHLALVSGSRWHAHPAPDKACLFCLRSVLLLSWGMTLLVTQTTTIEQKPQSRLSPQECLVPGLPAGTGCLCP